MNNLNKLLKSFEVKKAVIYLYSVFLILILFFILKTPYFRDLNFILIDQLHGGIKASSNIVIVGIDDKSLQEIGAWPWNREIFATALTNLDKMSPKAAGIDVLFLEKREGDDKLNQVLETIKYPLVLGSKFVDKSIITSIFSNEKIKSGYVDLLTDQDGKIRRIKPLTKTASQCLKSLSYSVFTEFIKYGNTGNDCLLPNYISKKLENDILYFNYTSNKFLYLSFVDLYKGNIDLNILKNKIILIGSTAKDLRTNLNDNFVDIFGYTRPGIEIHANILNSFILNKFQSNMADIVFFPIFGTVSLALLFFYRKFKKIIYEIILFAAALILTNIFGVILFDFGKNWNFTASNLILVACFGLNIVYKFTVERKEKRFIQKAFGQYINPALLNKLVENPDTLKLGGERKQMTVLFSDIRGFTTVSESMEAEELTGLINDYLDHMSEIILKNDGTIDKFIGDAIMAFWNAPIDDKDHCLKAIKTALEMEKELEIFNKEHPQYSAFKIGIGINTGEMVVGNIGSRKRFDYTLLGDNVNLGSRIEGLTKKYKVGALATEQTLSGISDQKFEEYNIIFRLIDDVIVKGKTHSIKIFQPLIKTLQNIELKNRYEAAFEMYQKGNFDEAKSLFTKIQNDETSKIMEERINNLSITSDWHGVWKWEEK